MAIKQLFVLNRLPHFFINVYIFDIIRFQSNSISINAIQLQCIMNGISEGGEISASQQYTENIRMFNVVIIIIIITMIIRLVYND